MHAQITCLCPYPVRVGSSTPCITYPSLPPFLPGYSQCVDQHPPSTQPYRQSHIILTTHIPSFVQPSFHPTPSEIESTILPSPLLPANITHPHTPGLVADSDIQVGVISYVSTHGLRPLAVRHSSWASFRARPVAIYLESCQFQRAGVPLSASRRTNISRRCQASGFRRAPNAPIDRDATRSTAHSDGQVDNLH